MPHGHAMAPRSLWVIPKTIPVPVFAACGVVSRRTTEPRMEPPAAQGEGSRIDNLPPYCQSPPMPIEPRAFEQTSMFLHPVPVTKRSRQRLEEVSVRQFQNAVLLSPRYIPCVPGLSLFVCHS